MTWPAGSRYRAGRCRRPRTRLVQPVVAGQEVPGTRGVRTLAAGGPKSSDTSSRSSQPGPSRKSVSVAESAAQLGTVAVAGTSPVDVEDVAVAVVGVRLPGKPIQMLAVSQPGASAAWPSLSRAERHVAARLAEARVQTVGAWRTLRSTWTRILPATSLPEVEHQQRGPGPGTHARESHAAAVLAQCRRGIADDRAVARVGLERPRGRHRARARGEDVRLPVARARVVLVVGPGRAGRRGRRHARAGGRDGGGQQAREQRERQREAHHRLPSWVSASRRVAPVIPVTRT